MSIYPKSGANVARCDLEVFPGWPAGERVFEWEDADAPESTELRIGESSWEGDTVSDQVTFDLPDLTEMIGQTWVLVDTDTDVPLIAGEVVRWADGAVPSTAPAVKVVVGSGGATVVRTVPGTPGTPGGQAEVGLLAARPDASTLIDGAMFFATDDNGGTLWAVSDGAWAQVGPSTNLASGRLLATAAPTSAAALAVTALTRARCPEFTTGSFTMPDRPVRARMTRHGVTASAGTDLLGIIAFTTNGWTTHTIVNGAHAPISSGSATMIALDAIIAASVGATVQVALYYQCSANANLTPQITPAFAIAPFLDVVAF